MGRGGFRDIRVICIHVQSLPHQNYFVTKRQVPIYTTRSNVINVGPTLHKCYTNVCVYSGDSYFKKIE